MDHKQVIADEAARIVCVEQVIDYRAAKTKAAQRLGYPPRAALPDNAAVQAAIVAYQRLFGGESYRRHLAAMRRSALIAMRLLAPFSPRLVGAAVSGAATAAHRVQLHAFAEPSEAVDMLLLDRALSFDQDERSYRYPDGREALVPLTRLDVDALGVDIAVFDEDGLRRVPIDPADGRPYRRLTAADVEALLQEEPGT